MTILDSQLVKTVSKGAARLHGQSDQFNWALSMFGWNMQVIKRCQQRIFKVLPKRWIVKKEPLPG